MNFEHKKYEENYAKSTSQLKFLKTTREEGKDLLTTRETNIRITAGLQARRQWKNIFKVLKKSI